MSEQRMIIGTAGDDLIIGDTVVLCMEDGKSIIRLAEPSDFESLTKSIHENILKGFSDAGYGVVDDG